MTTALPTPLAINALALLAERPMHPYEMYQLARSRHDDRLVKLRPGTLYHAVGRLAADGYVAAVGTERDGNRPERTTYAITEEGRSLLRHSVATMLGAAAEEYPVLPFALAESHNLPAAQVVELLETRLATLSEQRADLAASLADLRTRDVPWAYWLHVDFQQHQADAEAAWLAGAIDDIRRGRFAQPRHHTEPQETA